MRKPENLLGKTFNFLTVVEESPHRQKKSGAAFWVCRCECGNHLLCRADNLKSGHSTKCSVCAGGRGLGSIFVERGVKDV